jgi:sugar phosphate isomerase/epimerase
MHGAAWRRRQSMNKWSYMDHWLTESPKGLVPPSVSRREMERYIKQIAGLGFKGLDIFGFKVGLYSRMFGSFVNFEIAIQDMGMEKVTTIFHCMPYATKYRRLTDKSTHDTIVEGFVGMVAPTEGSGVEGLIIMPGHIYFQTEPVTDDKIKMIADVWNRVGQRIMEEFGVKLLCHHEFWNTIRSDEDILRFYELTDPRYVFYFCDTAQHVISGSDPVALYLKLKDRTAGFHFKDTLNVDMEEAYRTPPDAEICAPSVERWFYEMGAEGGLVDFPLMMKAIRETGYDGWLSVEHDKANIGGGNYAESTCISKWYMKNVLKAI